MTLDTNTLYNNGTIEFLEPSIGYTTLKIGQAFITGISYINPYVVYDVADWLINACHNNSNTEGFSSYSIMLDCESLGTAYLTSYPNKEITIMREYNNTQHSLIAYADSIDGNETKLLNSLANSIEKYFNEFIEFEYPEEDEKTTSIQNLKKLIQRLRDEAILHESISRT